MAEFIMKDIVAKSGKSSEYKIESCATSSEELGNDIYPPAKRILSDMGVSYEHRAARRLISEDYNSNNLLIVMDRQNLRNTERIVGKDTEGKVRMLMSFAGEDREVSDPWYSGDFRKAYDDIHKGCLALFNLLERD